MTEYQDHARIRKSLLLHAVLTEAGGTAGTLPHLTDDDWRIAAAAAGVPAPSQDTRAQVAAIAAVAPLQPADPFVGLAATA